MSERVALDSLSDWVMPPLSARYTRPVRVFDTAEAAMAFLETLRKEAQPTRSEAAPDGANSPGAFLGCRSQIATFFLQTKYF